MMSTDAGRRRMSPTTDGCRPATEDVRGTAGAGTLAGITADTTAGTGMTRVGATGAGPIDPAKANVETAMAVAAGADNWT